MSPHTLRAYGDDVARFLDFAREHIEGASHEATAPAAGGVTSLLLAAAG